MNLISTCCPRLMCLSAIIHWSILRSINSGSTGILVSGEGHSLLRFIRTKNYLDPQSLTRCLFLASDAVNILHQRGICQQTNAPLELVASDILDHYRTYALLEKLLHTPTKLASEQLAFQIEPQTSQMLIEM